MFGGLEDCGVLLLASFCLLVMFILVEDQFEGSWTLRISGQQRGVKGGSVEERVNGVRVRRLFMAKHHTRRSGLFEQKNRQIALLSTDDWLRQGMTLHSVTGVQFV